jgi:hypothetical protein
VTDEPLLRGSDEQTFLCLSFLFITSWVKKDGYGGSSDPRRRPTANTYWFPDTKVQQPGPNMGRIFNRDNFLSANTSPENEQIGKSRGNKNALYQWNQDMTGQCMQKRRTEEEKEVTSISKTRRWILWIGTIIFLGAISRAV